MHVQAHTHTCIPTDTHADKWKICKMYQSVNQTYRIIQQLKYWRWLSLLIDAPVVSLHHYTKLPSSQVITFTRFSKNLTFDLEVKNTDIQTDPRTLVDAPMLSIQNPTPLVLELLSSPSWTYNYETTIFHFISLSVNKANKQYLWHKLLLKRLMRIHIWLQYNTLLIYV